MTAIGAVFVALICWAAGRVLFKLLQIRLHNFEHDLLACFAGMPIVSILVLFLSLANLAWLPVFLLLAVPLTWIHRPYQGERLPQMPRAVVWGFGLVFAFYTVIYLANSLAPEKSPDGMAYHLGLVARYWANHGMRPDTTNLYGMMPQGMEMLYLVAFSIGKHSAAATVHCLTLLALPLLVLTWSRRHNLATAGAMAGLLVFLSPIVGIDGVSAYNDVALAASAFAAFYLLDIWRQQRNACLLIPVGLLTGFCFSIKYTGFAVAIYALLIVRRRLTIQAIMAASLIALPWIVRNIVWTGNPVAPFFNGLFRNPFIHILFENLYRGYFRNYALPSLKPLPWMLTVTGELGGQLGPLFLLAPIGLLALRTPIARRVLLAAGCLLIPYPANIGARFLIPALPFIAIAMALALRPVAFAIPVIAAVLAWPRVIDLYRAPAGGWQITTVPWQVALGIDDRTRWLRSRSGEFELAELINRFARASSVVWSTDALAEAYLQPKVLVNYYSAKGESIEDSLAIALHNDLQPNWRLRFRFTPQTLSELRVSQSAGNSAEIWSIGEAHFYSGVTEILPTSASAKPFPWDIQLSLDRNPTTRWRTWEPIHPGMYVDYRFDRPQTIDRVDLDCSHDQWAINLSLGGLNARMEKIELPAADLRRLATQTIKARGVTHLFIGRGSQFSTPIDADPNAWGLRLLASHAPGALYQIP